MDKYALIMEKQLEQIVNDYGNCDYWIYPFGEGGRMAKSILNVMYDIEEAGIIDNKLSSKYPNRIKSLKTVEKNGIGDGIVLVTSYRLDIHDELLHSLYKSVPKSKCIDIFSEIDEFEEHNVSDEIVRNRKAASEGIIKATKKIEEGKFDKYLCYHPLNTNSTFYLPYVIMDYIQRTIFLTDNYYENSRLKLVFEEFNDSIIRKKCKGGTMVDAGANIGNHSLYFANEIHADRIYAFEPMKETFNILKKNVSINRLENKIELFNCGLSDVEETAYCLTYDYTNIGGTHIVTTDKSLDDQFVDMRVVTLDETLFEKGDKIDFIKIDVEGMELRVLNGAKKIINRDKPVVMIESFNNYDLIKDYFKVWDYDNVALGTNDYLFFPQELSS